MSESVESQDYVSLDDAAKTIGWNRATVYDWLKRLDMHTKKFVGTRKAYLAVADVERLQEVKAKPWIAGEKHSLQGNHRVSENTDTR